MKEGEGRLMIIVPMSLVLVFLLLYLAFHSFLDAFVVLLNVVSLSLGGIWALFLTGTNFSIAAAVGFTSIFGVAIMDGLLLVSSFNHHRAHGLPLKDAIMTGAEQRVRPVMMTALTAILGLLPAAVSTKIGAQSQQPLAIVVVRQYDHDTFPDSLSHAGHLQLLRRSSTCRRGRRYGTLRLRLRESR